MSDSLIEQLESRLAAKAEAEPPAPPPEPEEEPQEDAPEPEDGPVEVEEEQEQPEEIGTLADFAKAAGWEPADVYALKFTLDTGEELALGEIKDKLQTYARQEAGVKEQTQRLNEYAEQLQAQAQQYFAQRSAESAEVQAARENMSLVEARYNSVDWDKLAAADPGRAAYLQQQLATDYAGAKQAHAQAQAQQAQAQAQLVEQSKAQHAQALLQAIPEWRDSAKVQAEFPALQQYLHTQGFRQQELDTIYDHRALVLARKAMLYDQGVTKMKETQEKVRAAPKPVVKPGTGILRGAAESAHVSALTKKAHESGSRTDKTAAAAAILTKAMRGKR